MKDEEIMMDIRRKLALYDIRQSGPYPETKSGFKRAAVLLPLTIRNGEIFILLTKRSKDLRNHPSVVSFPGGMRDETDVSDIETALREANEEIGLLPNMVKVIAVLTRGITLPNTVVYPVVGFIPKDFLPKPNPTEVDYTFLMPLKTFLDENCITYSNYHFRSRTFVSRSVLYSEGNKTEVVWGFTASFCTFLAKIIFASAEFFSLNDSVPSVQGLDSELVEYFDFVTQADTAKL